MLARIVGGLALAAALAGCSGPEADDSPDAFPTSPTTEALQPTPDAGLSPSTTEELHLLGAPVVSTFPPAPEDSWRSTVTYRGGQDPTEGARWLYTLQAPADLGAVSVRLWIQVVETLVVPPSTATCVWSLDVNGLDGADPILAYPRMCSGPQGPTISPGTYELSFEASSTQTGGDVEPGHSLQFHLRRAGFSPSPDDAVFALSDAAEHDSAASVEGLQEPLPPDPASG